MEPIKLKIFRHSDLPKIFGYNPLPMELLSDYLKPRPGILDNIDIFLKNYKSENKKFSYELFVETDDNFDFVVFGTYLELFEYHGLYEKVIEAVDYMVKKYPNNKIIFYYNHDHDFLRYNSIFEKYDNTIILNHGYTSSPTSRDILLPFWNIKENQELSEKTQFSAFIGNINNGIRANFVNNINEFKNNNIIHYTTDEKNYYENLSKTIFSLCPLGGGGGGGLSYRVFESLQCNSIPVIIVDNFTFPMSDVIKWENISIRLPQNITENIDELFNILQRINYQYYIKNINETKHLLTLNGIQNYVYNKLKNVL